MRQSIVIFMVLLFFETGIKAQNYQSIEEVNTACAQLGFMGDEDAEIAVDNILAQIGLFKNFTIQECPNINNAVAKNIDVGNGKKERYILYDNEFFHRIESKAENDWAAISILAHEIGHHLNGHALNDEGSSHKWELEADEWSGFVLARMGASLEDAQSAIKTLKLERATRTHPAKADRLNAIEKGWNRGKGNKITIPEVVVEDQRVEVIGNISEDVDRNKLKAQKILENYIEKIGGEDRIREKRTLSYNYIETTVWERDNEEDITLKRVSGIQKLLSPSRLIKYPENNVIFSELIWDGKVYRKYYEKDKWWLEVEMDTNASVTSFIGAYDTFIKNKDVNYVGVEFIDGNPYHVIEYPPIYLEGKDGAKITKYSRFTTEYYSVKSSMKHFTKFKMQTEIDYFKEYMKDEFTEIIETHEVTNYADVDGVKMPATTIVRQKVNGVDTDQYISNQGTNFKWNIPLNKKDFNPNN